MVNKLFNVEIMRQVDRYDAYCEKNTHPRYRAYYIVYACRAFLSSNAKGLKL